VVWVMSGHADRHVPAAHFKPELEKWTPIIKGAGIKIDRRALYSPENSALLIHINELA
jgi:hypothetical protein